ncbi:MAG: OmpA family protein [Flavobacteriales bacterium]
MQIKGKKGLVPILFVGITIVTLQGCVSTQSFGELQSAYDVLNEKAARQEQLAAESEIDRLELEERVGVLEQQNEELALDTARLGRRWSEDQRELAKLRELNDALEASASDRMSAINAENKLLLSDLKRIREELQQKEDALIALEADLNARSAELEARARRVQELEDLLAAREAAAELLRERLASALLGFQDQGLTVEQRDGKVYVSLEAQLLFPSGSTAIDPNGKQALKKLAGAIAGVSDLEIIVEGHTDADPLQSPTIPRNNWELSVLRSTAVIEILTQAGVPPAPLSASGRSEYHPIDPENKAKNRRIEIILAPNLNSLYEIIRD